MNAAQDSATTQNTLSEWQATLKHQQTNKKELGNPENFENPVTPLIFHFFNQNQHTRESFKLQNNTRKTKLNLELTPNQETEPDTTVRKNSGIGREQLTCIVLEFGDDFSCCPMARTNRFRPDRAKLGLAGESQTKSAQERKFKAPGG